MREDLYDYVENFEVLHSIQHETFRLVFDHYRSFSQ